MGRVRQQVHVQIAVAVIIEEEGLGGKAVEVEAVLLGAVGERAVPVVDVEDVVPVLREKVDAGDVDVDEAVPVDVGAGDSGLPSSAFSNTAPVAEVADWI